MSSTQIGELEQFIYRETAILDDRRYEEWLSLLTDDVVYWVPNVGEDAPPGDSGVIVREGLSGLRARVARVQHRLNPAQMPAPRTRHFVTNIMFSEGSDGTVEVITNLLLYVVRDERVLHYPGKCEYKLRKQNGEWRISSKKVYLITNELPMSHLPIM